MVVERPSGNRRRIRAHELLEEQGTRVTHLLLAVRCNAQCAQAVARVFFVLYRLIYHVWGISGVMKTGGAAISLYGGGRMAYLVHQPLEPFRGEIRLVDDHYVVNVDRSRAFRRPSRFPG